MFSIGELYWPVRQLPLGAQLSDNDTIDTPAGTWRVVHTPGHTPGHIAYFRESDRTLISGDALLNILPFIRKPGLSLAQPVFTSDLAQARQSAHKLAALSPRILLPGHGSPLSNDTTARIAAFVARLHM
ncbi:MAG: MBL fold metallo-hydrolase [Abitibacteriaceae bacterium]|nr:MBL fold metallo-hydrolase [Abditibacteriaceae bacterium]